MILHTGMRTDIPAFYSRWFLKRLEEGFVLVRNPYNSRVVTRYRLSPEVVDLLCFCTKNPAPMLPYMEALEPYNQYWFVTITPYGRDIEPHVPDKRKVLEDFRALSAVVGRDAVVWRYDPILLNEIYTRDYHLRAFERMARILAGYTRTCVISFIDLYDKVRRNFSEVRAVERADRLALGEAMAAVCRRYSMALKTCGEGEELAVYGVDCSGCMTIAAFETALRRRLHAPKEKPLRKECACYLGRDIGAYNTCGHLCRYCYANHDAAAVLRNMANHDPDSPFLLGGPLTGDKIHPARQESWLDFQLRI